MFRAAWEFFAVALNDNRHAAPASAVSNFTAAGDRPAKAATHDLRRAALGQFATLIMRHGAT